MPELLIALDKDTIKSLTGQQEASASVPLAVSLLGVSKEMRHILWVSAELPTYHSTLPVLHTTPSLNTEQGWKTGSFQKLPANDYQAVRILGNKSVMVISDIKRTNLLFQKISQDGNSRDLTFLLNSRLIS